MASATSMDHDRPRTAIARQHSISISSRTLLNTSMRILEADVPLGMWSATAQKAAQAPTLADIRDARYETDRLDQKKAVEEGPGTTTRQQQSERNGTLPSDERESREFPGLSLRTTTDSDVDGPNSRPEKARTRASTRPLSPSSSHGSLHITSSGRYPNGYKFAPKHTWRQSLRIGFLAFVDFLKTPMGILITIYGLNVVAWGAMIFFLLIGASSKTMCNVQRPYDSGHYVHDCNDLYSPRRIWIEVDSQVLTALFCVTAFGLVPWRFRDLFYLLKWRLLANKTALRRLAGWHRSWFRLQGSDQLDPNVKASCHDMMYNLSSFPEPPEKAPDMPLTGVRAPPTSTWKMDFVIWGAALNTFIQIVLCYYMWAMNRFVRPSWATGCFVALGCISAGLAGLLMFIEGKKIKRVEGVPLEVSQAVGLVVEREALTEA